MTPTKTTTDSFPNGLSFRRLIKGEYSITAYNGRYNSDGWVRVYGHGVQSIVQAGMPHALDDAYKHMFIPPWVADACQKYGEMNGYGGMSLCQFLKKLNAEEPVEIIKLNVTIIQALEKLEEAALGNARKNMLKAVDSPQLRDLLFLALSPDVTFGMKKLPAGRHSPVKFPLDDDWYCELIRMLDQMKERDDGTRALSGSNAKVAVANFLGQCTDVQCKWAERVILQDLRLSIGAKDVNKVLDEVVIPLFALPLAEQFKKIDSTCGRWLRQPKMDGGRVVTRMGARGGPVVLLSRSGKEWSGFHAIKASLTALNKMLNSSVDMTLDGEIAVFKDGRMDFQAMQKLFHVSDDRDVGGEVKYVLFDYCTSAEYDEPTKEYETRFNDLKQMSYAHIDGVFDNIEVIDNEVLINPTKEELDATAMRHVVELGCDGSIIRKASVVPRNKKTTDIIKVKPFEDGEAIIKGKVEGRGHLEGSLGTMVCQMYDKKTKKGYGPDFEIGTGEGLTKKLRKELWEDPDLIGSIVNFKYQRLSDDGVPILNSYRAIRHPNDM